MLATRGDNRRILSNPVLQWCVAAAALIGPAGIVLISGHRHAPGDPLLSSHSGPLATEVPGLLVSDRVMDLGSVPHGAIAVAKFQLISSGNAAFTIDSVSVSCGCMSVTVNRRAIAPAAPAEVTIKVDTALNNGSSFQKDLAVHLGGALAGRTIALQVRVAVDYSGDLIVFPGMLDFGDLLPGEVGHGTLYVRGAPSLIAQLPAELALGDGGTTVIHLAHTASSRASFGDLETRRIECRFLGGAKLSAGSVDSKISFDIEPGIRHLDVPITANVVPPVLAIPRALLIAQPDGGVSTSASVTLRSSLGKPLRLSRLSTNLPVTLTVTPPAGPTEVRISVELQGVVSVQRSGWIKAIGESGDSIEIPVTIAPVLEDSAARPPILRESR